MEKDQKPPTVSSPGQRIALMLFGVFLTLVILEIGLQTAGFVILAVQQYKNWSASKNGAAYRIMCVGESTTQGQYPRFLEKILNAQRIKTQFSVIDEGLSATNTDLILERMESNIRKYRPDAVVAMIGINDAGARHMPAGFNAHGQNFFQALKTYKLMQLLGLHIQAKWGEKKQEAPGEPRPGVLPVASGGATMPQPAVVSPGDDSFYVKRGMELNAQGKVNAAKFAFHKAIRINPGNSDAYFRLMWLCEPKEQQKMLERMIEKYKKEFVLCPRESGDLRMLFVQLIAMHKYAEAEVLLKALMDHCHAGWISLFAGEVAAAQGRYDEAVVRYKESIELNKPGGIIDVSPYFGLAHVYRVLGKFDLSEDYLARGYAVAPQGYASVTVENYHKIKKLLDQHGIRLVCVQYAMRNIEPLKQIFPADQRQNVSFVDNERLFKDALKKYRFEQVFRDRFAGDFGHCTDLGNTMLAGNIARVILRDVFGVTLLEEAGAH